MTTQIPELLGNEAGGYRLNSDCKTAKRHFFWDWLPLLVLPALVLCTRDLLPAWVFMWLLAWAIFWGCKWLTWRRAWRVTEGAKVRISLAYLFAWVGMDARGFLRGNAEVVRPKRRDWLLAAGKLLLGVLLVWVVARRYASTQPLVAGWLGMVGLTMCLHFGLFHLISLAWQRIGVNAQPLMRQPLRSASLAEFWGRRWNGAFHSLVDDFAFRPLLRRFGATFATLLVFLISGLIHDLIISLPARGGYGLPTAYFMVQGFGVVFERTAIAKRLGLRRGLRGWLFMIACTIGPAFWLFHPRFVRNVILPMLHAIGAT